MAAAIVGVVVGFVHAAMPSEVEASSLDVCQAQIREASLRLTSDTRRRVGTCAMRGLECLLTAAPGTGCCARAAERCADDQAKLAKAVERFQRKVANRRCADVSFADLLASDGLGFQSGADVCATLDPAIVVIDVVTLAECLGRLIVTDVTDLVARVELPRGAEALDCAIGIEGRGSMANTSASPIGSPATCEETVMQP